MGCAALPPAACQVPACLPPGCRWLSPTCCLSPCPAARNAAASAQHSPTILAAPTDFARQDPFASPLARPQEAAPGSGGGAGPRKLGFEFFTVGKPAAPGAAGADAQVRLGAGCGAASAASVFCLSD